MKDPFNATWKDEAAMDDEKPDMSKRPPREWAWLAKLSGQLMGEVLELRGLKDELLDELDYVLSVFDRLKTPAPAISYPAHLKDQQFVVYPPTPPRGAAHPKKPLPPKWADLLPDTIKMKGDIPVLKLECDRLIFQIKALKEIAVGIARQQPKPQPTPMPLLPALQIAGLLPAPKVGYYWLIDSVGVLSFPQPATRAERSPERAKRFAQRTMRASLGVDRKARAQKARHAGHEYPREKSRRDTLTLADLHGIWLPNITRIIHRPTATPEQQFLLAVVKFYTVAQTMLSQTDPFWLHQLGAGNITSAIERGWLKVIANGKLIVTIEGHALITYTYEKDLPKIQDLHEKRRSEQIAEARRVTESDTLPNLKRVQYRDGNRESGYRDAQEVAGKLYKAGLWNGTDFVLVINGTAILSAIHHGCPVSDAVQVSSAEGVPTFKLSEQAKAFTSKPAFAGIHRVNNPFANRAVSSARF